MRLDEIEWLAGWKVLSERKLKLTTRLLVRGESLVAHCNALFGIYFIMAFGCRLARSLRPPTTLNQISAYLFLFFVFVFVFIFMF